MNLTEYSINHSVSSWLVVVLLIAGGILSFNSLGRLEDPAFTIKQAIVSTVYSGASAMEVEEEVTLPIENAIQQLPYVDKITSISSDGLSQIEVEMKSTYRKAQLAQIWDEMRRKINDMTATLPTGVSDPQIIDDFSDVYGMFFAVTGADYDYAELENYVDYLRRELVLVEGVGKVVVGGKHSQQVIIEVDRARLAATGFSVSTIQGLLAAHNLVSNSGHIQIGTEYIRVSPTSDSEHTIAAELGGLVLSSQNGQVIYLSDVANIYKDYVDPPSHIYRFNGESALTLGISFSESVNVVDVGELIKNRLTELEYQRPIGIDVSAIYDQPGQVEASVNDFLVGLAQAVGIVIAVLLVAMGLRAGILMSGILLLTIFGTFIIMRIYGIELHRISLGALIIALGMLVDNAIVVTEGVMIGLKRGLTRIEAAKRVVNNTRFPLLGATIIAITAFAPIGLSPDKSGEFTGSLFWVLFISLSLSWVLAVSLTPFFCYLMFKEEKGSEQDQAEVDPYKGVFYRVYKKILNFCLRFRWATMVVMITLLMSAVLAFTQVRQAFFPDSSLPMFMVNYWLPQGTDIRATEADIRLLEKDILAVSNVSKVTATVGRGAARFQLTYAPQKAYNQYAQLLVEMETYEQIAPALDQIKKHIAENYPQAFVKYDKMTIGPSTAAKIEARLSGPDPDQLRQLAQQVMAVLDKEPDAINVIQDWYERARLLKPVYDESAMRRLGISEQDLNRALKLYLGGVSIGLYRDGSDILPIVARSSDSAEQSPDKLQQLQVYSPVLKAYVDIGQLVQRTDVTWEDSLIKRRDRKRTLSVLADPNPATGSNPVSLLGKIRSDVEAIDLPRGYTLEWGGEYEAQQDANKAVFEFVPLGLLIMVVITVLMFNSVKQTLVIWITIPLAIIGVAYGLLLTDSPFSFTALLAVLSLIGMQIKNGIVLVEEIKLLHDEEHNAWLPSIQDAAVSRLRPVSMAAITTVLGMIPLLSDVFFQPMAVTIMFGLGFATLLTLIVVPVLFALFYGARVEKTAAM